MAVFIMAIVHIVSSYAQSVLPISGEVLDGKNREPLIGVTVVEKGTKNGVITDIDGKFSMRVPVGTILKITYMGYRSSEVIIRDNKPLTILLDEENIQLDELVVIGYGVQKKSDITGSISSVSGEELTNIPVSSPLQALQGKAAGVNIIQNTGAPGSSSTIKIRGTGTVNDADPLYVVDGFIVDGIDHLNANDIANIEILKDAASSAVYGARAANGVVVITTKGGASGKTKISFDMIVGFSNPWKKIDVLDAEEYALMRDYVSGNSIYSVDGRLYYSKDKDGGYYYDNLKYTKVDTIRRNSPDNWWDAITQTGLKQQYNLSVSGGTDRHKYMVSGSYYNEKGLTRTAEMENYDANIRYDRYNYTANLNLKPTETTTIDLGFNGFLSMGNYPQQSTSELFASAMEINPVYLPLMMPDGSVPGISTNGDLRNPYADLTRRGYKNEARNQLNSNIRLTQDLGFWKWSKGLTASAMLAFDVHNSRDLKYNKREDTYNFAGTKDENGLWNDDVFDADGNYRYALTYTGHKDLAFDQGASDSRSTYFEASLNYDRSFGLHRIGGLLLYNQKIYRSSSDNLIGSLPYKQQGLAARATYSWNDRYFFEVNLGYNGSENFSPEKRFGFFPAFGLGWAISNEAWWESLQETVSYFKVRYTDGLVGTDAVTGRRFMYLDQMASVDGYRFGDQNNGVGGWGFSKYGANVGWSTSRKQDLGVDLKFFKDNLSLTLDIFKEHRKDIFITRRVIPDYSGFVEMPYANLGVVDNKGFEATLEYTQQLGKKCFLTVRGNFSWNEDKIIENDDPRVQYPWMEKRGTNVNGRWGWIAEGLFTSEEEIMDHAKQFGEGHPGQISKVGDIKYKDLNGDGVIDDYDKCLIGQGDVPKIYYGFGADLQLGDFSVGALFAGNAKADRCLGGNAMYPFNDGSGITNLFANITDRWSADNPTNQDVFYPRLHHGNNANQNNMKTSTWWQKDVSFLRLKQLTIAYQLPKKLINQTFLKSARIYVMGTNLLTFSKFKLWDPELNTNNGTAYPNVRTYSVGVNVSF